MNIMRKIWTFLIFSSLLGSGGLFAQQSSGQEGSTPADNTTVNQRGPEPKRTDRRPAKKQPVRPRYHPAGSAGDHKGQVSVDLCS